ncbi:hypothetical protein [Cupriavidus taiwanensis]|uniref:hypothetical protein n=1 Tax=Cupriavidus taiwanensis TaxID=164546 RepID=UPI0011C04552|nr:hypothetical protein [Cupriavidus taiwanensis]
MSTSAADPGASCHAPVWQYSRHRPQPSSCSLEGLHEFIEDATPILMLVHGGGDWALRERRLRIAFKLAFGSIINGLA